MRYSDAFGSGDQHYFKKFPTLQQQKSCPARPGWCIADGEAPLDDAEMGAAEATACEVGEESAGRAELVCVTEADGWTLFTSENNASGYLGVTMDHGVFVARCGQLRLGSCSTAVEAARSAP